jgi:Arc/MetJ-type ribon-helix-helix transcriptional regulator
MEATRRLEIELPEEMAQWLLEQVDSGRFQSASNAVGCGLTAIREQDEDADPEIEAWLKDVVVPRLNALDEGRARTMTVDEVTASLARRRAVRDAAA